MEARAVVTYNLYETKVFSFIGAFCDTIDRSGFIENIMSKVL